MVAMWFTVGCVAGQRRPSISHRFTELEWRVPLKAQQARQSPLPRAAWPAVAQGSTAPLCSRPRSFARLAARFQLLRFTRWFAKLLRFLCPLGASSLRSAFLSPSRCPFITSSDIVTTCDRDILFPFPFTLPISSCTVWPSRVY